MSRKLVVNSFLTLDGVVQAPGGPEEHPTGGFIHGGWSAGYWDEDRPTPPPRRRLPGSRRLTAQTI